MPFATPGLSRSPWLPSRMAPSSVTSCSARWRLGTEAGAALGPMAVRPAYQRQGIGSQLVAQGLERLREQGCPFVVVIGHPEFYPRFGFEPAAALGLTCDWEVPAEAFMVNILNAELGGRLRGRAQYRAEFSTIE